MIRKIQMPKQKGDRVGSSITDRLGIAICEKLGVDSSTVRRVVIDAEVGNMFATVTLEVVGESLLDDSWLDLLHVAGKGNQDDDSGIDQCADPHSSKARAERSDIHQAAGQGPC